MKLRAGQLWEIHHSQVTLKGVLVSIWGRHENKEADWKEDLDGD